MERIVFSHYCEIHDGGTNRHGISQKVIPDYDQSDSCRSYIFLSTSEYNSVLQVQVGVINIKSYRCPGNKHSSFPGTQVKNLYYIH